MKKLERMATNMFCVSSDKLFEKFPKKKSTCVLNKVAGYLRVSGKF